MNRCVKNVGVVASLAFVIFAGSMVRGEDKPKAKEPTRVYAPYSHLTDLSEDQKKQVAAIQADYRARIKALEAEETTKVDALLTEPQKKAVAKMESDADARHAEASKEYREKAKEEKEKAKEEAKKKAADTAK
jgi:hypothetical protein